MDTTPQQLKTIAEALGYTGATIIEEYPTAPFATFVSVGVEHCLDETEYNPTTNRAQLDELLEWLGLKGWIISFHKEDDDWAMIGASVIISHKNRTTAILMAACKECNI